MAISFRKRILGNELLISDLAARGFVISAPDDDENHCTFIESNFSEISTKILISIWDRATFRCTLIVCSKTVTDQFHKKGLFLDDPVISRESSEGVLAVELLWLRWNDDPENSQLYRNDYSYVNDSGTRRFFEDFDNFAQPFISMVTNPRKLANLLANLDLYPVRIKLGGKPRSVDPFIYAAILYLDIGDKEEAREALDRGTCLYAISEGATKAQINRYEDFLRRRQLLLS